ncbi:hypothetical protein NPIL_387741 [Nephila pilipes]|uniref:Uncharacterized protein n=1 Tax=Nephila pilipes TaxID=299642 RepID=A0A8X6TA60_NEPPI|nr:hypothetical protein NPIL_387741 [Nephila pilipes]
MATSTYPRSDIPQRKRVSCKGGTCTVSGTANAVGVVRTGGSKEFRTQTTPPNHIEKRRKNYCTNSRPR